MFKSEYPLGEYLGIIGYVICSIIFGFYFLNAAPLW